MSDSAPAENSFFRKAEPFLFFFLVALNAWPVLAHPYFHSLDGPSHLYNSVLLRELIFGNDPAIHRLFVVNPQPVPNLLSHVLLAAFSGIFPLWLAEKLVLLLFLFGLPFAFRAYLLRTGTTTPFASALMIPATFSHFLYLGFYNFLLAFVPFFLLQRLWMRSQKLTWRSGTAIFICLALLYFSHLYVFGLAVLLMGSHAFIEGVIHFRRDGIRPILEKTGGLLLLVFPFALLFIFLIKKTSVHILSLDENFSNRIRALLELSSLKGLPDVTTPFTRMISVTTGLLAATGIFLRFVRARKKEAAWLHSTDSWLLAAIVLFALYLLVPDYVGGGMNCVRLQFMVFICTITWIALQKFPRVIFVTGAACVLLLQFFLVRIYAKNDSHESEISEWTTAGAATPKGTLTLPIVFTSDERWIHSSGYLGATSATALDDNYEAGLLYFPVTWKNDYCVRVKGVEQYNDLIDTRNPAIVWIKKPVLYADQVAVWGTPATREDSITFAPINAALQENYALAFTASHLRIYRQKK